MGKFIAKLKCSMHDIEHFNLHNLTCMCITDCVLLALTASVCLLLLLPFAV